MIKSRSFNTRVTRAISWKLFGEGKTEPYTILIRRGLWRHAVFENLENSTVDRPVENARKPVASHPRPRPRARAARQNSAYV